MFGYVVINPKTLSKEEKNRYRSFYCGLCHKLADKYGNLSRATLTYDMTFLTILLSSLYELEETQNRRRCARHPIRSNCYIESTVTSYAADMNILLSYFQCLDDLKDDQSTIGEKSCKRLEEYLPLIEEANPRQYLAVNECLQRLKMMEMSNELNPDLPANCFGELVGALFAWRQDDYADRLYSMGAALGRFIYLLDAVNDRRADIKKLRYNPLVSCKGNDFTPMLTMMIAECTGEFEKLPIKRDRHIIQNVLYSGVWQKYKVEKRKGEHS
ncbi:MAG: hypothetical protein GXY17_06165 [Clostridiaceae bacterium]|jgi:hypothetical protein|nr:hypothetical protein [Clostridiaceae bacterium]